MGTMKDPDDDEILARYVRNGRLRQYPARPNARRLVLEWLATQFMPGERYSEATVNEILGDHAVDHATLRRYLVDAGLLAREHSIYWRTAC